ncbi:MAG TPA: TetR/AcrR family transcriptional regulator [Terracidiphilus sp.]|nr:TetR/AcrR family transcriptional regulator [Terracidiphilus sp.]
MPLSITHSGSVHEDRILAAATQIFLENGYEDASTAAIARKAKVSKRELYANFRGKREVLAAVITRLQAEVNASANISLSSNGELKSVLTQAGIRILRLINSERFGKVFRIVAAEVYRDPLPAQRFYLLGPYAGRDHIATFLRRHIRLGNLRKTNAQKAADDFLALLVNAQHLTALVLGLSDRSPQPRTHARHAVEVFLAYYGTRNKDRASKTKAQSVRPAR